jgi:hypothetical protein
VHFLDSGRLFAADGPSTSPNAANALPPMSVPLFFSSIPPSLCTQQWGQPPLGQIIPRPSSSSWPHRHGRHRFRE